MHVLIPKRTLLRTRHDTTQSPDVILVRSCRTVCKIHILCTHPKPSSNPPPGLLLVLVKVDNNPARHLAPPQLLHTLRHLAHSSNFRDALQQPSSCEIECCSGVLHGADETRIPACQLLPMRTIETLIVFLVHLPPNDMKVLEREEIRIGAQVDLASRWESDAQNLASDAVTNI